MPPVLFGASREPVLNGIGSQRNREMLSADNIHPRQAPCCQLTTTSSRGAVIWQEFRPSMSLCWSGSQLGPRRISHRAEARCGCFAACYPKERLAFGTGRLVLLNSTRTVRREAGLPNVACDGPISNSSDAAPLRANGPNQAHLKLGDGRRLGRLSEAGPSHCHYD